MLPIFVGDKGYLRILKFSRKTFCYTANSKAQFLAKK